MKNGEKSSRQNPKTSDFSFSFLFSWIWDFKIQTWKYWCSFYCSLCFLIPSSAPPSPKAKQVHYRKIRKSKLKRNHTYTHTKRKHTHTNRKCACAHIHTFSTDAEAETDPGCVGHSWTPAGHPVVCNWPCILNSLSDWNLWMVPGFSPHKHHKTGTTCWRKQKRPHPKFLKRQTKMRTHTHTHIPAAFRWG